jgi:hypothetical protein
MIHASALSTAYTQWLRYFTVFCGGIFAGIAIEAICVSLTAEPMLTAMLRGRMG